MEIEKMEDEFQVMYLVSEIVGGTFKFFKIKRITSGPGKPPFELKYDKFELLWIY